MNYHYWEIDGTYAIHRATGYECNLSATLGPGYTWLDHVADKPWATPRDLRELAFILSACKYHHPITA
jgi:hypothetical protein